MLRMKTYDIDLIAFDLDTFCLTRSNTALTKQTISKSIGFIENYLKPEHKSHDYIRCLINKNNPI